jgi:hypothetical protein
MNEPKRALAHAFEKHKERTFTMLLKKKTFQRTP